MGAFYGNKIENKEINTKTGQAWTLNDVPQFWKGKTEKWLLENKK